MIADDILSVYRDRQHNNMASKTIKIRADIYEKLLQEIPTTEDCIGLLKPRKLYGMEIECVSSNEDYRFMIMD